MLCDSPAFEARFSSRAYCEKRSRVGGDKVVPAARRIVESMEVKTSQRQSALKISQIKKSADLAQRELGTERIWQVLRPSLVVQAYVLIDGKIRELFCHIFSERNYPLTLPNGARFLKLVLGNSQGNAHLSYEMAVPIALEARTYCGAVALMNREIELEKLNFIRNAVSKTMAGMAVQQVQKACNELRESCLQGALPVVIQPYQLFSPAVI